MPSHRPHPKTHYKPDNLKSFPRIPLQNCLIKLQYNTEMIITPLYCDKEGYEAITSRYFFKTYLSLVNRDTFSDNIARYCYYCAFVLYIPLKKYILYYI